MELQVVVMLIAVQTDNSFFALSASQGGPFARPPLAIPRGTRLRGPAGSLRCSTHWGRT